MEDAPIEAGMIDRVIENAQVKVEGFYFDSRKNVLQYDEVVNEQRTSIYAQRQFILEAGDKVPIARSMIEDLVSGQIADAFELGEDEDADEALRPLRAFFPAGQHAPAGAAAGGFGGGSRDPAHRNGDGSDSPGGH